MTFTRHLLTILLLTAFHMSLKGENTGWEANPEIVAQREEARPGFIWRESDVPKYELPDPLRTADGAVVRSPEEWTHRREELLELFREKMYGRRPGLPDELSFRLVEEDRSAMDGTATLRRVEILSTHDGRHLRFELLLFLPNAVETAVPVFLLINNRRSTNPEPVRAIRSAEEVIRRGYGIAAIQNRELAPDHPDTFHHGIIRLFEGDIAPDQRAPDAGTALAAWGWGASRALDYFETDERVDSSRVGVIGHSRSGKAALWAGAEDERFSFVISNNSGCGGAALSKRRFGETVQAVNRFTYWFARNFSNYINREEDLDFDQHMLISLIAPRLVYVASADQDLWTDPRGEFLSLAHASPVYALWNHPPIDPDGMPPLDKPLLSGPRGYHIRSGTHSLTPQDWHYYMDFADLHWR